MTLGTTTTTTGPVRVCALGDLEIGLPAQADVGGRLLALVRTAEHEVHAVDDTCSHAQVSLSEGELEGCELECWMHGSRFDLRTGAPSGPPALTPIAVYPVTIDGEDVLVDVTRPLNGPPQNGQTVNKEN